MKRTTLLCLSALSVMPLHAAGVSPRQFMEPLLAPATPAAPKASVEQRAELFSVLAPIPAGLDFFAVSNIPQLLKNLVDAQMITTEDIAPFINQCPNGIAIAFDGASWLKTYSDFQVRMTMQAMAKMLVSSSSMTQPEYKKSLDSTFQPLSEGDETQLIAEALNADFSPVYVVADMPAELVSMLVLQLAQLSPGGKPVEMMPGITLSQEGKDALLTIERQSLLSLGEEPELALQVRGKIYVKAEFKEQQVLLAIASKLEDIAWAPSADSSVLATAATDIIDAYAKKDAFICTTFTKASQDVSNKISMNQSCLKELASMQAKFAELKPEDAPLFQAASASFLKWATGLENMIPPTESDFANLIWFDKGFHWESTFDAMSELKPTQLNVLDLCNDQTVFYMQSAPITSVAYQWGFLKDVHLDALNVAKSVNSILLPEYQEEMKPVLDVLATVATGDLSQLSFEQKMYYNAVQLSWSGLCDFVDSLTGSYGLKVNVGTQASVGMPQLSLFVGVENKEQLLKSGKVLSVLVSMIAKQQKCPIDMTQWKESQQDQALCFTYDTGLFPIQASVGDSMAVVGNSPAENAAIQAASLNTQGPQYKAFALAIQAAPLFKVMKQNGASAESLSAVKTIAKFVHGIYMTATTQGREATMKITIPCK